MALLDTGKMKKSLLTKWKNLDALTHKLNLQHGPWLSGCFLFRKYANTLQLIVFINNTEFEPLIINLVSKHLRSCLGIMANFEAREEVL